MSGEPVSKKPEPISVLNAEVTAIKNRSGRDLGLPGGVRTARTFARLGLIDQYILLVEPVALGTGQRLFESPTTLNLISAKKYACGVTRLAYRPARTT